MAILDSPLSSLTRKRQEKHHQKNAKGIKSRAPRRAARRGQKPSRDPRSWAKCPARRRPGRWSGRRRNAAPPIALCGRPGPLVASGLRQGQQFVVSRRSGDVIEIETLDVAAALLGLLATCLVDADVSHGGGGRCEKVTTVVVAALIPLAHKPQVGFVNQSCGIERLA